MQDPYSSPSTRLEAQAKHRQSSGRGKRPGRKVTLKRLLIVVLTVALGLMAGYYWYVDLTPEETSPALFEVKEGDFKVTLTELGELRALDSVTVSARTSSTAITYLIPEGTQVKKGDVLARLDPTKYEVGLEHNRAAVQVADAEVRAAEKNLEVLRQQLLAQIASFEAEVNLARLVLAELKRKPLPDEVQKARLEVEKAKMVFGNAEKKQRLLPDLVEKGFITKDTLDKAELEYLEAKAGLQVSQFNLAKVSAGATPHELAQARIRLEMAKSALEKGRRSVEPQLQSGEASVERAKANDEQARNIFDGSLQHIDMTVLRAPQDGLVVYAKAGKRGASEKIQLGVIPYKGQPLIHLPDLSTMVVDTEINEIDIGKVKIGMPVEVKLEAYPGAVFPAKVLQIASLANVKQGTPETASGIKVFDVTVQIDERDTRLRPGLTAVVDFIVEHQENVISVPLSAVVSQQDTHVVFITRDGKIEERQVVLGSSNAGRVMVKEGLHPGEQVLVNPPDSGTS